MKCEVHVSEGGRRKYGGLHSYGLATSDSDQKALFAPFSAHAHVGAAKSLPKTGNSLLAWLCSVLDQGQTSSCVGHSFSGTTFTALCAAGTQLGWIPSPLEGYKGARALDRGGATWRLRDEGTDPALCATFYERYGMRPLVGHTKDGRLSDCETDDAVINADPDFASLLKDGKRIVQGIQSITTHGDARVLDFCHSIDLKRPVGFSLDVDTAFEDYDGTYILTAPDPRDNLGGHEVFAYGYEIDSTTGEVIGLGQNSWGTGWGLSGRFKFNTSFIKAMTTITSVGATLKVAA